MREGTLDDHCVVLMQSGPGRPNAARATEALIDGHRPKLVISAGFAGGLDVRLHRGDIVWVDGLVDEAGEQYETERRRLPAALAEAKDCFVGRLLTVDRIIRLPDEKLALGRQYAALACDMESIAVAEVCRRREVPFLAVRVINDAADDLLPRMWKGCWRKRPARPARARRSVRS